MELPLASPQCTSHVAHFGGPDLPYAFSSSSAVRGRASSLKRRALNGALIGRIGATRSPTRGRSWMCRSLCRSRFFVAFFELEFDDGVSLLDLAIWMLSSCGSTMSSGSTPGQTRTQFAASVLPDFFLDVSSDTARRLPCFSESSLAFSSRSRRFLRKIEAGRNALTLLLSLWRVDLEPDSL